MSQNIFQIDPIFFLPIDLEDNSNIPCELENESSHRFISNQLDFFKEKEISKIKKDIENENTDEYNFSEKEMDQFRDLRKTKIGNNKKEGEDFIIYSKIKNDCHIKSMINSSKIYISEILKPNWKLKSRRLITKLKKKLIKKCDSMNKINYNLENNNSKFELKNFGIFPHKNIINLYNINNNILNCNNNFMNKNNKKLPNKFGINKFCNYSNICTNINVNINQFNNNFNFVNGNSISNNLDQY